MGVDEPRILPLSVSPTVWNVRKTARLKSKTGVVHEYAIILPTGEGCIKVVECSVQCREADRKGECCERAAELLWSEE
jgi:hypothetical protein